MKPIMLIGLSACGLMVGASHAATFTCKFQTNKTVVATCPIDTTNPNKTCEAKFSNTLQGSCGGTSVGSYPLIVCAFHDPKIKSTDALQMLREEKEGAAVTTPAGFLSGGATIAGAIQAFTIAYVEKSGAPQLSGGCSP